MLYGVRLHSCFWQDGCLVDPFHVLRRNKSGKQVEFAKLFGSDIVGSGFECVEFFKSGRHDKIVEHCSSDIEALDLIYEKMLEAGFVR
jgi:hypothetical protein